MNKPTNTPPKEWISYIESLEEKIKCYESKKTIVNSYFGLKKIVDDLNGVMKDGIELTPNSGVKVAVISSESLSSKDDKMIDRLFNFIKNLEDYNKQLEGMEKRILPQIKEDVAYGSDLEEALSLLGKQ